MDFSAQSWSERMVINWINFSKSGTFIEGSAHYGILQHEAEACLIPRASLASTNLNTVINLLAARCQWPTKGESLGLSYETYQGAVTGSTKRDNIWSVFLVVSWTGVFLFAKNGDRLQQRVRKYQDRKIMKDRTFQEAYVDRTRITEQWVFHEYNSMHVKNNCTQNKSIQKNILLMYRVMILYLLLC